MRRAGILLSMLFGLIAVPQGGAFASTQFGANLSRPADNPYSCTQSNLLQISTTCSAESINPVTGESPSPPAGEGIVSAVRVKVGPITGPMQIVEEEALREDHPDDPGHPTYACCSVVGMSPVFTPAANAITTVPVNFRVKQDIAPEPSGYFVDDHLSLSVLDPNVPIPASNDPNASVGIWFPAWQKVGEQRAGIYGTSGATILFNGDWDPVGGGGPAGDRAGAGAAVTLPGRIATVRDGKALLPLVCALTTACVGRLALQSQQAATRATRPLFLVAGRKKKIVTYASVKFTIPAGKRKTVKAKLLGPGKRLLKHRSQAKAWANVTLKGGAVAPAPTRITLKVASDG